MENRGSSAYFFAIMRLRKVEFCIFAKLKNNTPDNTQSVLPCRTNKALSCLFTIIPPQKKYNNPPTLNHQASKKQTKKEKQFCRNLPKRSVIVKIYGLYISCSVCRKVWHQRAYSPQLLCRRENRRSIPDGENMEYPF